MTEPGFYSLWGSRVEYQGRNYFEGGQEGIKRDIKRGMEGYETGRFIRDYFRD